MFILFFGKFCDFIRTVAKMSIIEIRKNTQDQIYIFKRNNENDFEAENVSNTLKDLILTVSSKVKCVEQQNLVKSEQSFVQLMGIYNIVILTIFKYKQKQQLDYQILKKSVTYEILFG